MAAPPCPIIYVYNSKLPSAMASAVNVTKSCAAFAANGHPVTLVHYRTIGSLEDYYGLAARFRTVSLPLGQRSRIGVQTIAWTAALMAKATGALVYAREPVFLVRAAKLGCPVALELHKPVGPEQPGNRAALATLLGGSHLRKIISISQALAAEISDEWPSAASRIVVAHDGADVGPAPKPVSRKPTMRPLLGYAGHLYPGKGMEMIAELARARPDWDFLVLGGRPDDVKAWRRRTRGQGNLTLAGMLPHVEVAKRLMACDILLAPYSRSVIVSDGRSDVAQWMSPLKLFEYMALAKPVVVSDLPVIREVVRDGDNGRLAAPDDSDDWERIISELLATPVSAREMGRRARSELEQRYSWKTRARTIADAIGC